MKSRYLAGYVDPSTKKYFPNVLTDHMGNAEKIIEERGWNEIWRNDIIMRRDAIDFLIFRKKFIQIGNCDERIIIASDCYDSSDVFEILSVTDFGERYSDYDLSNYKLILIMSPKY